MITNIGLIQVRILSAIFKRQIVREKNIKIKQPSQLSVHLENAKIGGKRVYLTWSWMRFQNLWVKEVKETSRIGWTKHHVLQMERCEVICPSHPGNPGLFSFCLILNSLWMFTGFSGSWRSFFLCHISQLVGLPSMSPRTFPACAHCPSYCGQLHADNHIVEA